MFISNEFKVYFLISSVHISYSLETEASYQESEVTLLGLLACALALVLLLQYHNTVITFFFLAC